MKKSDFYYELPEELIAQNPLENRSSSRLLVLDRETGEVEHRKTFENILEFLNKGDCLVLNDTKVIPARLYGEKMGTGSFIEFVLLKKKKEDIWEVILRPGKKARPGSKFVFAGGLLKAEVLEIVEGGNRLVKFEYEGVFEQVLDQVGVIPLPPYITEKLENPERYQTVYARHRGSAAAPTAGLHFTEELLEKVVDKGVSLAYITLHVGLGTFRPVKAELIEEHIMHSESFGVSALAAETINSCKNAGGSIISVGTTSTRVLESVADDKGFIKEGSGDTSIFIYPGYKFKCIDKLITNFHLPESTLIMLVSALTSREKVLEAYRQAVEQKYRFFSFGDAMFIK